MDYGIAAAKARIMRFFKGQDAPSASARYALVLRLENADTLRTSLGPALLERLLDALTQRLARELRLLPQIRSQGSVEVLGLFGLARVQAVPGLLARLRTICDEGVALPDLRITPVVNAVVISDSSGQRDIQGLYDAGRAALQRCSPLSARGQMRFVDLSGVPVAAPVDLGAGFDLGAVNLGYLPQICCDSGRLIGLRVQIRIAGEGEPADLDLVQTRFDDETLGRIMSHALRQATNALVGWDKSQCDVPFLTLPLPDRALADPIFADTILWELERQDLTCDRLELEIAEPIGKGGGRIPVTTTLRRLGDAGCRLALGDFGTGSAGLDDLRRFGIRRVRIGRNFVADCHRRSDQQRMILAVLALAEHLKLQTLADGVQHSEENSFLAQIGINAVQGEAVAPRLAADAVDQFLQRLERTLPPPFEIPRRA